jgi:DNA polymerase phi
MGSKKRGSDIVDAIDEKPDTVFDKVESEPLKKKIKKEKKKENTSEEKSVVASTSDKPMERKKKRKAMDKGKHQSTEPIPKVVAITDPKADDCQVVEAVTAAAPSGGSLPEFHIDVFKDLASADLSARELAAEKLATELKEVQKAFEKLDKNEIENELKLEAEKDDGLNECAPSLRYAVRRLIRGVSSSRECARQGFALGLTVLLAVVPSIKVNSLMKLIVDLLDVPSSMKGQEAKDCLLGRLFAYGALARSGRLTDDYSVHIKEFVSSLISLASRKRYLQEPAVSVILQFAEKLPVDTLLKEVLEASGLQEWFDGAIEAENPDALLLALKIREKLSVDHKVFSNILPNPYSPSKLFTADYLSSIANCLKESTFCQPRIHGIWPVLVNILLPEPLLQDQDPTSASNSAKKHKKNRKSSSSEEDTEKTLKSFCEIIVEGSLLQSSHDRKHLAFEILLLILPKLPSSCISVVLSYKLVQCLTDILSTKDSWLYKFGQHFVKELSDWVKSDDSRRVAVIISLQKHSNGKFDCITRTKTVKDLMSEFKTESGCMIFIQSLINMFLDESSVSDEPSDQSQTTDDNSEIVSIEERDSSASDFLKCWVVDSLPSVLKHLNITDPESKFRVQKEILKFLAVQGLFSSSLGSEVTSFELGEKFKWPKTATSNALCRMCIEQLQQLLANAQKGEGPHAVASGIEANDLASYFMRFLSTLSNIPSVSLFRVLSSDDDVSFKKLQKLETQLSREERNCGLSTDAQRLHALRYLLIQLLLQVLLRPGEFTEAASELIICCKKAFPLPDIQDSDADDEPISEEVPELMNVLVDTLLSLLPQSSAPMRSAIEQVFKYFCDSVTDDGLLRMLRVIKKDLKPARHQEIDSDDDDEEDDDDLLEIEEAEESDTGETGGDSDEQTDDDSEAAVTVPAARNDAGDEDSDESDGGMDDDAMFRMDSYLAQIFRDRKNQAGSETAHSQLVLFKLRVLSLLEIYLHENPGKPQVLKVFSNLSQAFINPHTTEGSEQLGQRIRGILQKKILEAKDYPKGEFVNLPVLESMLEKNLKLASKPFKKKKAIPNSSKKKQSAWVRHERITSLAQNSTYWILKIIDSRNFSETELQRVFDIFKNSLTAYFDSKKSQTKLKFLKEIFKRRPWIGHNLFGFLLEKCGSAKSSFRQVEALDLLIEISKSISTVNVDGSENASKKMMKSHMPKFCLLINKLVTNMPKKQAKRAEVRKFCGKVFQIFKTLNLITVFLKKLEPEAHAACESQLGELFVSLKTQG